MVERECPFFRHARQEPTGRRDGKRRREGQNSAGVGWAEIYTCLIAHGHQRSDIGSYTERQLKLFYRQALKLERQRSAMRMLDVNAGMAGVDATKERLNGLNK